MPRILQSFTTLVSQSQREQRHLARFNTGEVVDGYKKWWELSPAEHAALRSVLHEHASILDLGCGVGRIFRSVSSRATRYVGVDQSPAMVAEAKRLFPDATFLCENFLTWSPKPGEVDTVLAMHNTLDPIGPKKKRDQLFRSIHSWLPEEGTLLFSTHVPSTPIPGNPGITLRVLSHSLNLIARSRGYAYVPEDYHGSVVWEFRATPQHIIRDMERLGFSVTECHVDRSRDPFDWIYYVCKKIAPSALSS
jgi:SAM-dependent methyltransferase